jgi:hypothetical protein
VAELPRRQRGAEQVRHPLPRDGIGAGAGDQQERLVLLDVVQHRERDIAALETDDQIDVVALDEFPDLLQTDLRIELVVLFHKLDFAVCERVLDLVEIDVDARPVPIAGRGRRTAESVQHADPKRLSRRGEDCRRGHRADERDRCGRASLQNVATRQPRPSIRFCHWFPPSFFL